MTSSKDLMIVFLEIRLFQRNIHLGSQYYEW